MRWNSFSIPIAFALLTAGAGLCAAASLGTVVPIGGTASDIALDESRGYLYIANFGANRIEVMSLSDNIIHTSINVAPHPGSIALSLDGQYLVSTHYNNFTTTASGANAVTVIRLSDNTKQTFATGDPPLGVAFLRNGNLAYGQALLVTTTSLMLLDPVSGQMRVVTTLANLAQSLPVNAPNFPGQIIETALATSGDGYTVWGVGGATTGTQLLFRYSSDPNSFTPSLTGATWITSPSLLARVSPDKDGSHVMIGWALYDKQLNLAGRYPNTITSKNITGHAYDYTNGIIYAQIPDASQPTGPLVTSSQPAGTTPSATLPALLVMDADNLTFRERLTMPENMVGRALLNSANSVLYAVSESGVMVLPVGSLNQYHRLATSQEDVLVQTSFCNRASVNQSFTITDPGGGKTDFVITASQGGVTVSPSSGVTPATINVSVDPTTFQNANGTTPITLKITSGSAVNQPRSVRLLMNNPDQNQRGTVVNVPGTLSDILADPGRNRYYILRQDMNQLLVFSGSTNKLIATLRTQTTPTQMSFTNDQKYLLVGHDDSQLIAMYDLDSLERQPDIVLPGGHYGRSIANSNGSLLVLARDEGDFQGKVDTINLLTRTATQLPSLGVYTNLVGSQSVLSAAPNGSTVLLASPDGTVMLYSASADTFTVARQDYTALSGAYAASSYESYVVGNSLLNKSLVPVGTLSTSGGSTSGYAFVDQGGFLATAASASSPGVIQKFLSTPSGSVRPTSIMEAPRLPTAAPTGSSSGSGSGSDSGSGSTNGSGSTSLNSTTAFTRTVAPLSSAGTVVVLTTSGFTVLANNYDAAVAAPSITSVVNAGDGSKPVAPGGLISVYGTQMSPVNVATSQIPLPTALGQSCLSVNGAPVPLLFVSSGQINAQLPYNVAGNASLSVHTPGGISNNFNFTVFPAAPSVFLSGTAGPVTGLPTIVRADNNLLVTPSNPIHAKDTIVIYLTGMGGTSPQVSAGLPAPTTPLAQAMIQPTVTLGGIALDVSYAGLVPGQVGVYQINAYVPGGVPQGLSVPLVINQSGATTSQNVRVVN